MNDANVDTTTRTNSTMSLVPSFIVTAGPKIPFPQKNIWKCSNPAHLVATTPPVKRARYVKCCAESPPPWKRAPADIDFAKDEQLEILEDSLDKAVATENFTQAAQLHQKLTRLQSGSYVTVLSTNLKFYHAFNSKSVVDMAAIWLQSPNSTCKHPGGPLVSGYVNIINSFGMLFTYDLPHMTVQNLNIRMRGTVGYVTCNQICQDEDEDGRPLQITTCATNVYVKHNSQWYLTHHSSFIVQ